MARRFAFEASAARPFAGTRVDDSSDDMLTRPLGVATSAPARRFPTVRVSGRIVAAVSVGGMTLLCAAIALFGDPEGGEPRASATIAIREPAAPAVAAARVAEVAAGESEGGSSLKRSAQEVEQASGVTVTRPAGATAPDAPVIIRVPSSEAVRLAAAPDPRLVERSRHGPLPRIGDGRIRPLDVYARPDVQTSAGAGIAILVSGLGVGEAATAAAITKLPAAISLAVSPYGTEADKTAARTRLAGHEILLQLPMEPFDYPDSDPGPQTLLTSARPAENLDRLAWAMSRFPGIVGIVNFMGGKLSSDASAFEPVLRDIGARGLGYVDDGTAPRSLATALAPKLKTPFARADLVIDAVPRPEAIDRELARLEVMARAKGFVVASASALPMTVDRIARWSRDLEMRGVRLIPISAVLKAPPAGTRVSSAGP